MEREKPEIEIHGLVKRYGDVAAVDHVSLQLWKGEFLSLLGPSGCGKTSTLRMIAGFVTPDEGRIFMRGRDITYDAPYHRDVGLLFQSYALFPHMTVFDNVGFGPRMRGESKSKIREKIHWALDLVRLSDFQDRRPEQLSGGQQQRVAVARVLAAGASILLLDEPFSNLDASLRKLMQDELRELQQRLGIATIHVTHDQEEAMSMSDRLVVMNAGRIEQEGTPTEVYRTPRSAFVAEFMGRCNKLDGKVIQYRPADGIADFRLDGGGMLSLSCSEPNGPPPGSIFVRPEHISAVAAGTYSDRTNVLSAELLRAVYLGACTTLHVKLENGADLAIQVPDVPDNAGESFPVGTKLDVFLPSYRLMLLRAD